MNAIESETQTFLNGQLVVSITKRRQVEICDISPRLRFFLTLSWAPLPDFQVSSDLAGFLGYAAFFQGHWFSGFAGPIDHCLEDAVP